MTGKVSVATLREAIETVASAYYTNVVTRPQHAVRAVAVTGFPLGSTDRALLPVVYIHEIEKRGMLVLNHEDKYCGDVPARVLDYLHELFSGARGTIDDGSRPALSKTGVPFRTRSDRPPPPRFSDRYGYRRSHLGHALVSDRVSGAVVTRC